MSNQEQDWFDMPEPETRWLVNGLITSDDITGFVGKPKSGKSTGIRNLAAAVIKGGQFLGRSVLLAPGTGRVLYVHLDRKDRKHQVASELKQLGVTREDKDRLRLLTEQDFPQNLNFYERCTWLIGQAIEFQPHLIVIDMLFHFMKTAKGVNDYDSMIEAINELQDRLNDAKYTGVLLVSLHSRKATSDDVGDSLLGSTGIRGSLSTGMYFRQYKKQKTYTVQSDQTQRDAAMGELDETIVNRDSGTGRIVLGAKFEDLKHEEKKDEWEVRRQKVHKYVQQHPAQTADQIADAVLMSKKTALPLLKAMEEVGLVYASGEGKKGDPKKYFLVLTKPVATEVEEPCQQMN